MKSKFNDPKYKTIYDLIDDPTITVEKIVDDYMKFGTNKNRDFYIKRITNVRNVRFGLEEKEMPVSF